MIRALKFEIYGRLAHFKNPENNVKLEVSYDNIPKPVLIGIIGAILGLKGRLHFKSKGYLEYWQELKGTEVAIIPGRARWRKHIDNLNNSTGFYNDGQNQMLSRQMLEDVFWTVYIKKDSLNEKYWDSLLELLSSRRSNFPIYLGKTECKARIGVVEEVELEEIDFTDVEYCDSLLVSNKVKEIEGERAEEHSLVTEGNFIRRDYYPISLCEYGLYNLEKFIFTNMYLEVNEGEFYNDKGKVITFF